MRAAVTCVACWSSVAGAKPYSCLMMGVGADIPWRDREDCTARRSVWPSMVTRLPSACLTASRRRPQGYARSLPLLTGCGVRLH